MSRITRHRVRSLLLAFAVVATSLPTASPLFADEQNELAYPGKELRDGILRLAAMHEAALADDPQAIAHHVGRCEANTMLWCFGFVPRDEVLPQMITAAERAVALDENDAGARTALGIVKLSQWDWASAEKELAAAVRLDPGRAQSRHWYALYLAAMGRHDEALPHSEAAVRLDPSPGMQTGLGSILYFGRDWPRMVRDLNATIDASPNFAYAYDWLGMAYVQQEKFAESINTYERAVQLSGGLAEIVAGLGHAYGLAGKEKQARHVLAKLHALDKRWYVPPVQIAYVHVGLGEHEQALQMLQRARQEHSWELVFVREEPWFDPLRSDPRFQKLLADMNFPEPTKK